MHIRKISNYTDFLYLKEEWNNLLKESGQDSVFLKHEWFDCWWRSYGETYEDEQNLSILLIEDEGKCIGMIPLKTSQAKYRGVKIRKIGFLESGISPNVDFILTSKREKCIREVISFLKGQNVWDILVLRKFMEVSNNYKLLRKTLEEESVTFGIKPSLRTPIIQVDGDWDNFFHRRPVKFRKSLRNKINKAKRLAQLQVEKFSETDKIKEALPLIFDISKRSWKGKIGEAIPDNKMYIDFYTELTDKLGKKAWINIWLLRSEDTPIAYEYHLKYKGIVYPIRADFDEKFRHLSPGSLLEYYIIKSLFEDAGVKEYDSCAADYQYLRNWTDIYRQRVDMEVFSPKAYPRFFYSFEYRILPYLNRSRLLRYAKNHFNKNIIGRRLCQIFS